MCQTISWPEAVTSKSLCWLTDHFTVTSKLKEVSTPGQEVVPCPTPMNITKSILHGWYINKDKIYARCFPIFPVLLLC